MPLNPSPARAPPAPEPLRKKGDLNDTVYWRIKEMILSGRLRPGNKLVHQELADQLSVSRTPVRESLERLYQEGYAGRRPRRGYYVAELNTADARDLYETREALEIFAFRKSCELGFSRQAIAELKALNLDYGRMFPESVSRKRLRQPLHVPHARRRVREDRPQAPAGWLRPDRQR